MQRPDTPDGLFHAGNPATGVKGTSITAEWLNALLGIATFFRGDTEPPAPELGDDGDFYICTPTRNMYGPKTAGEWGNAWVQGLPGPRGFRWYWGTGAPGVIAGQIDGDFYLDTVDCEIWQLISGVWTVIGDISTKSVLHGDRDPALDDGVDGDFWLNTDSYHLFGPKQSGSWGAGVSLVGPQGPEGAGVVLMMYNYLPGGL